MAELDKEGDQVKEPEVSDMFEKYGLTRQIDSGKKVSLAPVYSEEYKKFKRVELSKSHSLYEGLCNFSSHIIRPSLSPEQKAELENVLRLTHLDNSPESVYSLTYLGTIFALLVSGILIYLVGFSGKNALYTIISALVFVPGVFYFLQNIPHSMLKRWRVQASDQLVSAVLYMVVDIKRGSNLERSVYFTANRVTPPLSLDFLRMLWEFQVGKFATVNEALDNYTLAWKGVEDEFVDAIRLIISSQRQKSEQAERTLEKATDVILQGVQDNMQHFAQSLRGPVSALHMLGIVLPVLLLILLPIVAAFLKIPTAYLFILFDVVLPITIYMIAKRIISMRPGGISITNLDLYMQTKLAGAKARGILAAIGTLILFGVGSYGYYIYEKAHGADFTQYTDPVFYLSLIGVLAVGFALVAYMKVSNGKALKFKRSVEQIEEEFSSAAFQLGSRIEEGTPPELAFEKVARDTKGMEIQKFFDIISYNLQAKGMSLEGAIFDNRVGAVNYYPSPLIRSVMQMLVEGARKSLKATSSALLVISRYLRDTHRVYERLKDLLADTISDMQMQAGFFVAIVISIVTVLSTMMVRIMSSLSGVLRPGGIMDLASDTDMAVNAQGMESLQNISSIFGMENALAGYQFQIMVGIYLIIVVLLLSYVLALVVYGGDKIEMKSIMAKNLFRSLVIYGIGVVIMNTILGSMTSELVKGMVLT